MKINGKKIEGFVFDMDGLLLDSERIVQRSWELSGKELGIEGMGQQIYHTLGMNAKSRRQYFKNAISADFPYEEFQKLTSKYFYQITDTEGLPVKKEQQSYWNMQRRMTTRPQWQLRQAESMQSVY